MAIWIKKTGNIYFVHLWGNCVTLFHMKRSIDYYTWLTNILGNVTGLYRLFISPSLELYKTIFKRKIYDQMLSLMVLKESLLRCTEMFPAIGFPHQSP